MPAIDLLERARLLIDTEKDTESPDCPYTALVKEIDEYLALKATPAQVEAAREEWADDELEIDDEAMLSPAADGSGTWISAWVWMQGTPGACGKCGDSLNEEGKCTTAECENCTWMTNFYRHDTCEVDPGVEWEDQWVCGCDDECPACGVSISPYKSEDVEKPGG